MFDQLRSHFRAKNIRCQLSDISHGMTYFRGGAHALPLGWALVPMRRVGFDGNDNNIDFHGNGPRVLARDVIILEPYSALTYFLDDAEALDDCTPASKWFHWASDEHLLRIPKSELKRMSKLAYWAILDAIEVEPRAFSQKALDNLERHARLG